MNSSSGKLHPPTHADPQPDRRRPPRSGICIALLGGDAPTDWLLHNERARTDDDPSTVPIPLPAFQRIEEQALLIVVLGILVDFRTSSAKASSGRSRRGQESWAAARTAVDQVGWPVTAGLTTTKVLAGVGLEMPTVLSSTPGMADAIRLTTDGRTRGAA